MIDVRKAFIDSLRLYFAPIIGAVSAVRAEIQRRERERASRNSALFTPGTAGSGTVSHPCAPASRTVWMAGSPLWPPAHSGRWHSHDLLPGSGRSSLVRLAARDRRHVRSHSDRTSTLISA